MPNKFYTSTDNDHVFVSSSFILLVWLETEYIYLHFRNISLFIFLKKYFINLFTFGSTGS